MKDTYKIIKGCLIASFIMLCIELIFLSMHQGLRQIILSSIIGGLFLIILIMYFIIKHEVKKIIFEGVKGDINVRLIDYDDYPLLRNLLNDKETSNTEEEATLLKDFEMMTTDFCRIHYHYLVFKGDELKSIVYVYQDKASKDLHLKMINSSNDFDQETIAYFKEVSDNHKKHLVIEDRA